MKKLLIMASLFWPQKKSGGPTVSILNLVKSIKEEFDIYVISKNHEINDDKPLEGVHSGWNHFDFGRAYYVSKGQHTYMNIKKLIQEVNPDVIYQNSFFSYDDLFPVLMYKKNNKSVKVIVAPRGELYPEHIQVGMLKKKIYIIVLRKSGLLNDVFFQGTGAEECAQERKILGIPENRLLNIPNISILNYQGENKVEKKPGEIKLVYIARIHPIKGVLKAIQLLEKVEGEVLYDIYGAIEDKSYWIECQNVINNLPSNITVRYRGVIEHKKVSEIIACYHAYFMPTTGENYGHSIVESMLMGKPVIISDQTPWNDVNGNGGYAISLKDDLGFVLAIHELLKMDFDTYQKMSIRVKKYINDRISVQKTIKEYIDVFEN